MAELSMQEALRDALRLALRDDARTLVFGEDVGRHGGVFRVTDGLQDEFGRARVFDTPLAEAGIVGAAVGLCMHGWRPVPEIQFDGFGFPAFNQMANHVSKMRTRTRGAYSLPLTLRLPSFGGIRGPEHHSESVETFYAHLPGIKVVSPADPQQAFTLLRQAISDPDPVVFLEPKARYWSRGPVDVSAALEPADFSSRIARPGRHATLIAWGANVHRCLQAAEFAAEDGVELEVLDLRWLKPLDTHGIVASIERTGRAIVVQEAPVTMGLGAEICALAMEHCLSALRAPVVRVAPPDVPYPSGSIEEYYLPDIDRILSAVAATFDAPPR
jgi:pyruvate dehydrogenase E1 component beta subunit